jgi:UDPglucose 6-dehydrogenase/UDP-N-acetyl-D-galactosamine dehydrogenase
MAEKKFSGKTICVVGLGYVGTPLAEAFARHFPTIGYDIDQKKVDLFNAGSSNVHATTDPESIREADFVMICVPTPVTKSKDPDLGPIRSASATIGKNLKHGAIVVLESTVYPGVTEEIVAPILERESGMKCGKDFFVGYSPERINPNDTDHTLDKITKIVAGMDEKTTTTLVKLYSKITRTYRAPDIKTAEAAKVIENIQRDLNIALVNEFALIFDRMGINTQAVLEAAGTKWNFQKYSPGLVGGHCIPVDPYWLVVKAEETGYHPQVILAGRGINDSMPKHVAEMTIKGLNESGKVIKESKVLIMGLTYKEDVPDIRESPVEQIIHELKCFKVDVYGYDPLLSEDVIRQFDVTPLLHLDKKMDAVIIAVAHKQFKEMTLKEIRQLMNDDPVLIDVRGMMSRVVAKKNGIHYRSL